jgi:hypothetical protein
MKNIKALGLAALVVAALVALPASASATSGLTLKGGTAGTGPSRITSSVLPAKLSGGIFNLEMEGWKVAGEVPFKFGGPGVECGEIAYEGTEFSEALYEEFILNAKFAKCTFIGVEAAIKMNSCHYQFSALDAVKTQAIASIVCNKGDAIVVEAKGASGSLCTVELPSQTLTEPAGVVNFVPKGEGKIGIAMTSGGLEYTAKGSACFLGGVTPGTFKNGSSETYMLLHAVKGSGGGTVVPGLTIKGGTPETGAARITSSVLPAKLSGGIFNLEMEGWKVAGEVPFKFGGPGVECGEIAYEGPEFFEALVKEFTLNAKFAECEFLGLEAAIKMNSCHYQFSALDAVKTAAIASIACNKGDAIVVEAKGEGGTSPCTVELPSQTLTTPAGVVNFIVKGEGKIGIAMAGGGLEYTAKGSYCALGGLTPGTFKNGSSETYMLLHRA